MSEKEITLKTFAMNIVEKLTFNEAIQFIRNIRETRAKWKKLKDWAKETGTEDLIASYNNLEISKIDVLRELRGIKDQSDIIGKMMHWIEFVLL